MQTENIPYPYISGLTDSQKLQAVITYLGQLVEELKRQLSSIDTSNMVPDVAEKIEKCITDETDLSEYALKKDVADLDNKKSNVGHTHSQYALQDDLETVSSDLDTLTTNFNNHNHDREYAPIGHDHDDKYAPKNNYALASHTHSGYALSSHDHDYVYAPYYNDYVTDDWVKSYVASQLS